MQSADVMEDLEERIAELFAEGVTAYRNVVDVVLVERVIAQMGMPDGAPYIDTPNDPISDIFSGNRPVAAEYV